LNVSKENIDFEELFRNKLENSEIVPDVSVRTELMRKLAIREFLRFNPSRFNIYYLSGIAAAALVSILLLTSNPESSKKLPDNIQIPQQSTETVANGETVKPQMVENRSKKIPEVLKKGQSRLPENKKAETLIVNKTIEIKADSTGANNDDLNKPGRISDNNLTLNNQVVLSKPIGASFDASVTVGCAPLKIKFLNNSVSYDSCRWIFGDGGFSNEKNPEWIFDLEGEYKIVLKVFTSDGAQAMASTLITVHPRPVARFEITPEKPVLPDDEIRFLNYSVDAVRFMWYFGDGITSNTFEPDHKYNKYSSYNVKLIAWSEFGCFDSVIVKNAFSGSGCFINFPNAFIPGSDGPVGGFYSTKSDEAARIFHPITSGVADYHLKIFSKLGILIFESNDINIGWDGYLKGQLCNPGVYIWKVRGTYKNGEPFVKMGDVTLLKN
jgi:PKD repeat protein